MHPAHYSRFKWRQTWFLWIRWITEALFSSTGKSLCIAGRTHKIRTSLNFESHFCVVRQSGCAECEMVRSIICKSNAVLGFLQRVWGSVKGCTAPPHHPEQSKLVLCHQAPRPRPLWGERIILSRKKLLWGSKSINMNYEPATHISTWPGPGRRSSWSHCSVAPAVLCLLRTWQHVHFTQGTMSYVLLIYW